MDWDDWNAALFDLDGVLTPTTNLHRRAWGEMFTAFGERHGLAEPYTEDDYYAHVDGKPRFDGVRAFLASRGVRLAEGGVDDGPEAQTVHGLGNAKQELFNDLLTSGGMDPYPGTLDLLDDLAARGVARAVVSSSRNATAVLAAAGLSDRFAFVVDGNVAAERGLPGKPDPATFLAAATQLDIPVARCVVLEDALAGVAAGRAGGFGLVIGVDRGAGADALRGAGADITVSDLTQLLEDRR